MTFAAAASAGNAIDLASRSVCIDNASASLSTLAGVTYRLELASWNRVRPSGHVAAQLWPDQLEGHGRASLRRAIWQLPRSWIVAAGDTLQLNAAVDLECARLLVDRALSGEPLSMAEIHCLSMDLLPGWHDEWLVSAQDEFHHLRAQALESLCRTVVRQGDPQLATHAGIAAVAAEPLRESAAAALVVAHLAEGNRYEAGALYP